MVTWQELSRNYETIYIVPCIFRIKPIQYDYAHYKFFGVFFGKVEFHLESFFILKENYTLFVFSPEMTTLLVLSQYLHSPLDSALWLLSIELADIDGPTRSCNTKVSMRM